MRIDNRNYAMARIFGVLTIYVGLAVVANIAMTSQAPGWVRYAALGLAALVAIGGLWTLRQLVIVADFDDTGITMFTLRGKVERSWTQFEQVVISIRQVGPLQMVVLTLVGRDRRKFALMIRESHWGRLGEITALAKIVEVKD